MQIIVHVNGFQEWCDVPSDVDTKSAEFKRAIDAGEAKPLMNGAWSMRVTKTLDTNVTVHTSEADVIECVVQEMTRGDRQYLSRKQAVARLLSRHVLPHHCHESNMREVEIGNDDGPNEALFRLIVGTHVACQNISDADLEPLVAAYTAPSSISDLTDGLHSHFRISEQTHSANRAKRTAKEASK